jgi:competence ComEA-like helix-hairpin-helix protein
VIVLVWSVAHAAPPLDLNAATAEQLELLPSVGTVGAEAFLEWRAAHGPCTSLDDLAAVPNFGTATRAALVGRAWCGPGHATGSAMAPTGSEGPAIVHPRTIDVNHASVEELQQLPGIVASRARAIVSFRDANGPFASCADLVRVPGIGPATVAGPMPGTRTRSAQLANGPLRSRNATIASARDATMPGSC